MNASGSASCRQTPRFFVPMPGSISTITGAGLEQREREGEELQARLDHQHGAHAAADAEPFEAGGETIGLGVEFAEGEMAIAHAAEASRSRAASTMASVCG